MPDGIVADPARQSTPFCRETAKPQSQEEADALLLMQLAAEGQKTAFDALAKKYANLMLATTWRALKDFHDAQDAAQDGWVHLWKSLTDHGVNESYGPRALIVFSGRHVACHAIRARFAKRRGGDNPKSYIADILREMHGVHGYKRGGNDREMLERCSDDDPMRKMGIVWRLSVKMPAEHLAALDAYYFKGEALADFAARVGLSLENAKRRLCSGIQIMRALAERDEEAREVWDLVA